MIRTVGVSVSRAQTPSEGSAYEGLGTRLVGVLLEVEVGHSRCEVSCSGGCLASISVEAGPPHSTLVALKCANPVPCVPLPEHWLPI